jgi:hypothetical protein
MIGHIYPDIVGYIAMPTSKNRVPTPTDIPEVLLGMMSPSYFHVVVIVSVIGK